MVIRDDILDDIVVPAELTGVVSHALFQRLRGIGQTGLLYLVYPGMKHTRFEHSLGAMHLSLSWFDAITKVFAADDARQKFYPLHSDLVSTDGTTLMVKDTERLWKKITSAEGPWKKILSAAALLHDVGHGPFSHSIESYGLLSLEDSASFISEKRVENFVAGRTKDHAGEIGKAPGRQNKKKLVNHEDFSVVIAYKILSEANVFPDSVEHRLLVCALINKDFRSYLLKEGTPKDSDDQLMLRLLAPLISGLFDVDRMDYMRRDSVKAGVKYGLAEVQRLMSCLIPTLVSLPNKDHDVNIITRARNIHSVDHFLVALFQLYTTLYMHPSYEGYQHELGLAVEKLKETKVLERITLVDYQHATDSWLIGKLNSMGNHQNLFDDLVARKFKKGRESFQTYSKTTVQNTNYTLIGGSEREIIKDGVKVWLIDKLPDGKNEVRPWDEFSLVARNLKTVKHTPHIWWKNKAFVETLEKIKPVDHTAAADKRESGTGSR